MVAVSLIVATLLVAVDQLIKIIVDLWLIPQGEVAVLDGILSLAYVENTGAAWGALEGKRWFLVIVALVAIVAIIYMMCKGKIKGVCYNVATVLLLAGGLGNLIDRVFRGYVIDYLRVTFVEFPVFNFADCLITVGACFLIVKLVQEMVIEFKAERAKKSAIEASDAETVQNDDGVSADDETTAEE